MSVRAAIAFMAAVMLLAQAPPPPTTRVPPPSAYATPGVTFRDVTASAGVVGFKHVSGGPEKNYIVEATGSPDPTRSHFDAQDFMESGTPGKTGADGWLNRALPPAGDAPSPLRAIAIGTQLPRTLRGPSRRFVPGSCRAVKVFPGLCDLPSCGASSDQGSRPLAHGGVSGEPRRPTSAAESP